MKTIDLLWSFSLISIGICTIILTGANLLEIALPDFVIRIAGLIDLAALPVLGYTAIRKWKDTRR